MADLPDTTPDRPRPTLVVTVGLPGSGKSTWALGWVAEDLAGRARVGTDQIADMLPRHLDACIARDEQRGRAGGRSVGAATIRVKEQLWRAHQPFAAASGGGADG